MNEKIDYPKEVEKFIQRLNDGEFVFTSKATEMRYTYNPSRYDGPFQLRLKTISLADCLNNTIRAYICVRDTEEKIPENQHLASSNLARECYEWIRLAWLTGSLQEGQGLTRKLEEYKAENIRLQKELVDLSAKYLAKEEQLEGFETRYGLGKKKS